MSGISRFPSFAQARAWIFLTALLGMGLLVPSVGSAAVPSDQQFSPPRVFVVNHGVNVRSSPRKGAPELGTIQTGQRVQVTARISGWYEILLANGEFGYCWYSYLDPEMAAAPVGGGVPDLTRKVIEDLATEYYNTKSEWAGTFSLVSVQKMRVEDVGPGIKKVHLRYRYAAIPGNRAGRTDSGNDQRVFTFRSKGGPWYVTAMGDHMSAHF